MTSGLGESIVVFSQLLLHQAEDTAWHLHSRNTAAAVGDKQLTAWAGAGAVTRARAGAGARTWTWIWTGAGAEAEALCHLARCFIATLALNRGVSSFCGVISDWALILGPAALSALSLTLAEGARVPLAAVKLAGLAPDWLAAWVSFPASCLQTVGRAGALH